jgi:RHS repeat-associated protein
VVTEIEYRPITDTNIYVKGSGAEYPIRDIISPIYVVSDMIKDNGQDGTYETQYAYRSARYHVHGRGFLGFQQFISYDYETDLCYIETLAHDFPFTGRQLKTETVYIPDPEADPASPGYSQLIKQVDNTWLFDLVSGGTLFAYCPRSIETKWELGDTNAPVSVVTAYNWFDGQDTSSMPPEDQPTNLYADITHGNLSKNIIDYGGGLSKTTVNRYDDWVDSTHWLLGRLDESDVRHRKSGTLDVVRSSSFDYDAATGLLSQEVIEPDDPQFELVTDYYYDDFGNIITKVLTPAGLPARAVLDNDYDSSGRFVEESRNALGHPTVFVNDQALGLPLSATDPNGLTTYWQYDATGRKVYEQRPDGTETTVDYVWDNDTTVTVPDVTGAETVQRAACKTVTAETVKAPVTVWYDKQGRKIRTQTRSADDRTVNTDTGYNSIAQPVAVSEPYFAGETPVYTFTEYDGLGRQQYVTGPDGTVTETVYSGLSLSVIKDSDHRTTGTGTPKNQVTTSVKNAKGELLSVTDAMSNTVTYVNDAVGNLIRTVDPAGNVIEMAYDIRGNKIRQDDPDMGEWTYTYNALDQLLSQTDANGNIIETAYDVLGRPVARTNRVMKAAGLRLEGSARWTYDSTAEGGKIGALSREEYRDGLGQFINRKSYAYDSLGRPVFELRNYDRKWYYTTLQYDSYSRVAASGRYWRPAGKEGEEYNLDPQWNSFTTTNLYNGYSALLEVRDMDDHLWWEADASDYDSYGRLTQSMYGNGLTNTNEYDPLTGRVTGMGILDASQFQVSSFQFQYDRIGNLTQRSQSRPLMTTLTETSTYDPLNRLLTVSTASTNSTVVYDALGNILSRSDTGAYLYGTRPHAVTSVSAASTNSTSLTYHYDPNGNIVRRDRDGEYEFTAIWNSFNKPVSLFSGDEGSEFEYDVNGKRTQQLIFDGSNVTKKIYVAETYEMREKLLNPEETDRSLWQWQPLHTRIYVDTPAGKIGIYEQAASTNGTGAVTHSWMHKDHLGSVIAVSDESAAIEFYSYDAWGQNRNPADWSPLSDPITDTSELVTDRGFTGHEMLSGLDLIHMNGRIYDPVIGRFISPDPLIQSPDNLQSFNRYAYVWNNPLSYRDPSGFITSGLETVLGSARYGAGGGGGGGGGGDTAVDYALYAEPILTDKELAAQDTTNTKTTTQDTETNTESSSREETTGWDEDGNAITTTVDDSTTMTTVTQREEGGDSSSAGGAGMSQKNSDVINYGTHNVPTSTPKSEESSKGVRASETPLGKGTADSSLEQNKGKQSDNPAGDAAEGGTQTFKNGADTDAQKQADGAKLVFDGKNLSAYDKDGNLITSWKGTSGAPGTTPENQYQKSHGPIPEGKYSIDPSKTDTYHWYDPRDYDWSGKANRDAWGNIRTPIDIEPGTYIGAARTGGFFIHGGSVPGSAGCIDLTNENQSFHDFLGQASGPVSLEVTYESSYG